MQEHLFVSGQVIGDAGQQADAEVDVSAPGISRATRWAIRHGSVLHVGLLRRVVRGSQVFQREDALDEMLGVMMFSGSRSPSATSCETSTMVVFAAVAADRAKVAPPCDRPVAPAVAW